MDLYFFDSSGKRFVRSDAESAHWVQQEMQVTALFAFDPDKVITKGMQMAFVDPATGLWQAFECITVQTADGSRYQEVTAESCAIAELSCEHINTTELTDVSAQSALGTVLNGTEWAVGTVSVTGVSSCDISRGSVWQAIKTLETAFNAYCTPHVTVGTDGITAKYIDITPHSGIFRGLRLSINKNLSDPIVTYDESEVYTALYGYGGNVEVAQSGKDDKTEELTFAGVEWSATSDHPAKPAGQTYLEWPEKTALYGHNGRPRFGYYQNGNIKSAEILLQKTWETLQQTCNPRITISGMVVDLYRLGYADVPISLHDNAIVDIESTDESFNLEIVCCDVDLLDPSQTSVEIGAYIPNIIYINRETEKKASGGGGGGGRGQTNLEKEVSETYTAFEKTDRRIAMVVGTRNGGYYVKSGEIALAINKSGETGQYESTALINADHINISGTTTAYTLAGDLEHDANGRLVIKNAGGLYCARTKDGVTAYFGVWDTGNLTGGVMVDKINTQGGTQTKLTLQADVIDINGLISALESNAGWFTYFDGYQGSFTGELTVGGLLDAQGGLRTTNVETGTLTVDEYAATWREAAVATGVTVTFPAYTFTARKAFGYFNEDGTYAGRLAGSLVTTTDVTGSVSVATTTLYYLGRTASSGT